MTANSFRFCRTKQGFIFGSFLFALLACENVTGGAEDQSDGAETETPRSAGTLTLEERDVEAPEIFNVIDDALWDGRPSFGGVWVAYPGNTQPERVNIRNVANGKSVVGALFKREANNPGPKITVSSDAADELGVLAGTPTKLTITALRREPIEVRTPGAPPDAPEMLGETVLPPVGSTAGPLPQGTQVQSSTAGAVTIEQALKEVQTSETASAKAPEAKPETASETPDATAIAAPDARIPGKPFIQVGTFSSETNARDLATKLADVDVPATIRSSTTDSGRRLYRVVAGPAASAEQRALFSSKINGLGFKDTFPVSR